MAVPAGHSSAHTKNAPRQFIFVAYSTANEGRGRCSLQILLGFLAVAALLRDIRNLKTQHCRGIAKNCSRWFRTGSKTMLTVAQELAGVTAALKRLEARVKAYRDFLARYLNGESPTTDIEDIAVANGEVDTVETLISSLALRITGSPPQGAWQPFASFLAKGQPGNGATWAEQTNEHLRWMLLWLHSSRTYLAYLGGIHDADAQARNIGQSGIGTASAPAVSKGPEPNPADSQNTEFGCYTGQLLLKPKSDGRQMLLVEAFEFVDSNKKRWPVPKGATIDGASIPQALWSLTGGPFEGIYRDASVIHDYYCSVRLEPWRDVHRMFYNAMRASGVSALRAKLMYVAVYYGGPRWSEMDSANTKVPRIDINGVSFCLAFSRFERDVLESIDVAGKSPVDILNASASSDSNTEAAQLHLDQIEQILEDHDPSLEEIDKAIDSAISLTDTLASDPHPRTLVVAAEPCTEHDAISFREPAIESAIRDKLGKPDAPLTSRDMQEIDGLDLRDLKIRDLSDLAHCTNIRILSLEATEVQDLSPIKQMNSLQTLSVNSTPVDDLSPIRGLTTLRNLFVGKTNVRDLSPLVSLTNLKFVSLAYSPVADIGPLVELCQCGGLKKGTINLWGIPITTELCAQVRLLESLDVEVQV